MTEPAPQTEPTAPPKPAPAKRRKVRTKAKPKAKPATVQPAEETNEFAGITANKCPDGCMKDGVCIISTVNVCKHPVMCGDSGCGPITMANRQRAMKAIKRQRIEAV